MDASEGAEGSPRITDGGSRSSATSGSTWPRPLQLEVYLGCNMAVSWAPSLKKQSQPLRREGRGCSGVEAGSGCGRQGLSGAIC